MYGIERIGGVEYRKDGRICSLILEVEGLILRTAYNYETSSPCFAFLCESTFNFSAHVTIEACVHS